MTIGHYIVTFCEFENDNLDIDTIHKDSFPNYALIRRHSNTYLRR